MDIITKTKQELTKLKQFAACFELLRSPKVISKCLLTTQQAKENLLAGIQTFLNFKGLS
jgi:hypothetical protein